MADEFCQCSHWKCYHRGVGTHEGNCTVLGCECKIYTPRRQSIMTRKEEFLVMLKQLRAKQCAYTFDFNGQAATCDCKFHNDSIKTFFCGEQSSGCPELLVVITRIEHMSDAEFVMFLGHWG